MSIIYTNKNTMANPKTFNNVYELLKRIAESHFQINTFYFGDMSEIDGKDNIVYPLLLAIPIQSEVNENTINHTFRIIVADMVDKDEANENEVLSDTQSILSDVVKVLRYESDDYNLLNSPILIPFTERFGDEVTGWGGEFEIEFDFNQSECNIPIDSFLTPGPTYGGAIQTFPVMDLDDLADVTITNPQDGDGLVYYDGVWVNQVVLNYEKRLVSGGAVWSGVGLVYDVSVLEYYFDAPLTSTVATQVTLSPGDADDDRFDAIVIDVDGNVLVIEGDPSPNPITPDVSDYVLVQFISVAQASVVPPVTEENIYYDNDGWTGVMAGSGVGTIDFDSTENPQSGTKCIKFNVTTGGRYAYFTDPTPISFSTYQTFQIYVKLTSVIASNKTFTIGVYNTAGALIGTPLNLFNLGLNRSTINTWQLVTFSTSLFNTGTTNVGRMSIRITGGTNTANTIYYIDNVKLFGNVIPVGPGVSTTLSVASEGTVIGSRPTINFIEGDGIDITVTDDSLNQRVNVNITLDTTYTDGIYLPLVGGEMTSGAIISFASAIDIQSDGNIDYEKAWVYGKDGEGMYFGYGYQQVLLTNTQFYASVVDSFIFISEVVDDEAIRIRTQVSPNYTELRLNPEANSLFESTLLLPLDYAADYSANYTDRSLIDKEYADALVGDYLPLAGGTLDNGVNPVTIDFLFNPLTTQKINFGDDESLQFDARANNNNNIANISLNTGGDLAITTYINDGDVWGTAIYSDTYAGLLGLQASKDADTTSIALQWNNITVGSSFAKFEGIKYSADYSTNYTNRSLVDKEYVDNLGFNQSATTTLTIAASTAIDVNGEFTKNFSATTSLTAVTFIYSNFNDGSMFDIDLLKTTASNTVLTFPASSVISVSGAATVSGLTATLSSTTSGRFTITGKNMDGVYKIYITQDVL